MKLLHVADLHLDTPFAGIAKQDATLQQTLIQAPFLAFERCVSIAINQAVDVMVIVGDLYDATKQTIAAQHFFYQQMLRLKQAAIQVVLCHGNHDFLDLQTSAPKYPDNVYLFADETIRSFDFTSKAGETARFYGFSYTKRWIKESKVKDYPNNPQETDFTIGLLHGNVDTTQGEQANYAPFSVNELSNKQYDYWALGHVHQSRRLSTAPLIQYPGTIQGRHRLETGDKGAYIIELTPNQPVHSEFISLAPVVWEQASLESQSHWQVMDLVKEIHQIINNYHSESIGTQQSYLVSLELTQAQRLSQEILEALENGELMDFLTPETGDSQFVQIVKITQSSNATLQVFNYDDELQDSYTQALTELETGTFYEDVMSELFKHTLFKKYQQALLPDKSLQNELKQSAKNLLVQTFGMDDKGGEVDEN
ncbi:metallophosphoesterase family protein [Tuanshanicoccus lijuaniae]|uniref:metallophosphoesterase family protein n=1 Tax=Aerococcaceae bacterium zg-1292 TaxID=2774330 RepID=UPI001BD88307|nr:DNA repair exonuclease [Aerococcaceae bacterium zg-A91]MBS4457627.1 DNA repair exonuclease [Aerococcaceae bacterium zg-BR33]